MKLPANRRFLPGIFVVSILLFGVTLVACLATGHAIHYQQKLQNRQREFNSQIGLVLPVAEDFFTEMFTGIDSGRVVPLKGQAFQERDSLMLSMLPLQQLAELGVSAGMFDKGNGWSLAMMTPTGEGRFIVDHAESPAVGQFTADRWLYDIASRVKRRDELKEDSGLLQALGQGLATHSDVPDQYFFLPEGKNGGSFVFLGRILPDDSEDRPGGTQLCFLMAAPEKLRTVADMIPVCGQPPVLICLVGNDTLPVVVLCQGVSPKIADSVLKLQEKGWPTSGKESAQEVTVMDEHGQQQEIGLFRTQIGTSNWSVILGYDSGRILNVDLVNPFDIFSLLIFVVFLSIYAMLVFTMVMKPLRAIGNCLYALHNTMPFSSIPFDTIRGFREAGWVGHYLQQIARTQHSLAKYLPEHELERIVGGGGDAFPVLTHLDMTVLFVQAPVQERILNHPEALDIIERFYAGVTRILRANSVVLDVMMPNGICACWENRTLSGNNRNASLVAINTAGEIVRFVAEYNRELSDRSLPTVPGSMGIYSGKNLCAGSLGTSQRLIFSLFGAGMIPLCECAALAESCRLAIVCESGVYELVRETIAGRPIIRSDADLKAPKLYEVFLSESDSVIDVNLIYCSDFTSACECLRTGNFQQAKSMFQALLLRRPDDQITRNCLQICERNLENDSTLDELTRALTKD